MYRIRLSYHTSRDVAWLTFTDRAWGYVKRHRFASIIRTHEQATATYRDAVAAVVEEPDIIITLQKQRNDGSWYDYPIIQDTIRPMINELVEI